MATDLSINLLKERNRNTQHHKVLLAKIQVIAGVVLAVYVGISLMVIGTNSALRIQNKRIENKIKEEELTISKLKPVESMYTLVVNKFGLFDDANEGRMQAEAKIAEVVTLLPDKTVAESIDISATSDGIEVSFVAASMFQAVELLELLEEKVFMGEYDKINIQSVSRQANGEYGMSVQLGKTMTKEGL